MELTIKEITLAGSEEAVWKFMKALSTLAADAFAWDGLSVTWTEIGGRRVASQPKTLLETFTEEDERGQGV